MLQILAFGVALSFAAQDVPIQHVRSSEPRILALINAGLVRSATFRRLVDTLNESDVIVYIETQVTRESRQVHRESLDAYLIHHVVDQGGHRYLRIGLGARGAEKRLIPILAHELQHAVEIARAPEVRDDERLQDFFSRASLSFSCAGMCYETQEAKDIQGTVNEELAEHAANSRSDAQTRFWFSRRWPSLVTRHTMHGSREGMAMSFYPGRSDEAPGDEAPTRNPARGARHDRHFQMPERL